MGFVQKWQVRSKMGLKGDGIRRFILENEKVFSFVGCVCKNMVRCGKSNCRCARGQRHGPYFYLFWRGPERAHRIYLGREGGEIARQTLLEIRRRRWSGYDHRWKYRRGIPLGLRWANAYMEYLFDPTCLKYMRFLKFYRRWKELRPAEG